MSWNEIVLRFLYEIASTNIFVNILVVFFGHYLLYILVMIAAGMIFLDKDFRKRYYFGTLLVLSIILSSGIVIPVVHYFYHNPRPFVTLAEEGVKALISHSNNSSMPSGHMMFVVPLALTVFYMNRKAGLWFLGGVVLMGISRIAAGVHWPLDIIVGILLGTLCFYIIKALLYLGGGLKPERVGEQ